MSHAGWIFRELQKKQADFNELKQRCKKEVDKNPPQRCERLTECLML